MAVHMWKQCTAQHDILWFLRQTLGQTRQAASGRESKAKTGRPKASTRSAISIRRRFRPSVNWCTAAAIFIAAITAASLACCQCPSRCTESGSIPKVAEDHFASPCQQDRKSGKSHRTFGSCPSGYHRTLAQVCPRDASDCPERAPQMHGISTSSASRADAAETRTTRTPDTGIVSWPAGTRCQTDTVATVHSPTGAASFGFACQFRYTCTNHICCCPGSHGRRCRNTSSHACASRRFTNRHMYHEQHAYARDTDAINETSIASLQHQCSKCRTSPHECDRTACTTAISGSQWTNLVSTSWQLGMATRNPCIFTHAIAARTPSCSSAQLAGHDTVDRSDQPLDMPCQHGFHTCRYHARVQTPHSATDHRPDRTDRSAVFGKSPSGSTGVERSPNRAGRGWRTRTTGKACPTVNPICSKAAAMPGTVDAISQADERSRTCFSLATTEQTSNADREWPARAGSDSTDFCGAAARQPAPHAYARSDSTHAVTWIAGQDASHTIAAGRHSVHTQLTSEDESRGHDGFPRTIPDVSTWTETNQDPQSSVWQCSCTDRLRGHSASPTIRNRQPFSHTGSDGNPDRCGGRDGWATNCAGDGLGSCEEHVGSHVLRADSFRATSPSELPQRQAEPGKPIPVHLNLDELLPMNSQETAMHQSRHLVNQLCQKWPDSAMLWGHSFVDLLPDLHPTMRHMIQSCPEWKGESVDRVHLYIDGSSFQNRHPPHNSQAAWAVIVVLQCRIDDNVSSRMLGAMSHRLSHSNMSALTYYGVGELAMDALSAEAVGMIIAMSWILQSPFSCWHIIHYDNATIGQFAEGSIDWQADWEHIQLKHNLAALRHCFQMQHMPVAYQHVKAHEGHPMNECADALAKATAKGVLLDLPIPVWISNVMHHRSFKFAWMSLAPKAQVPHPYALHGLFKAEGPFHGATVDTTWNHPDFDTNTQDVHIRITAATANVLTLAVGAKASQTRGLFQKGRIHTLQTQFQMAQTHIIGVQESRTQQQLTRHNGSHLVYQSGAAPDGSRGCELWLDRTLPYATSKNTKFFFQAGHVHIAQADDRCLLAIVRAPHLNMRVLVVHAPHQAAKDAHHEEWWNRVQNLVQHTAAHLPLIVLGDMNAKIGTVHSESVGAHGAEPENATGNLLHTFTLECRLWAPSTHAEVHEGPTHTWISSEGLKHRLDFVLIPQAWKRPDVSSFILQAVDLCTVRDDHLVAAVTIAMRNPASTSKQVKRFRIDTRKCHDQEAQTAFLQYIATPPPIPWEVGVGQHAEILTQWIQNGAHQFVHKSRSQPKQKYMSEFTWTVVLLRKELLKLMHQAERHIHTLEIGFWFRQWHNLIQQQSCLHQHDQTQAQILAQLQRQCSKAFAWALHHRYKLHQAARHSSREDRVRAAQETVDQFLTAAQGHDSKALYKKLQPLLGQIHRRSVTPFRPIPAVQTPDKTLATDHDTAAERWRAHFAEAEQGTHTTVQNIQSQAAQEVARYAQSDLFDFHSLPTLDSIESYIRRSKTGKSPGVDGLSSEIYRLAPCQFAAILWPLLTKCAVRCSEPLRWKGGEICSLPKKTQAGQQVENFRSILLADHMSKIHHGLMRQRLLPPMQAYSHSMQAGGLPKLGTDMLHLYIQSFAQLTRHHGVSSACLFVDIKQAFYRASRHLLVQREIHENAIVQFFASHGWNPDMYREFRARIQEPSALAQAHVSKHQIAQVDNLLSNTWFQVRDNPQTLTQTGCGTRPGDSVADLLFTYLMGRFIHALRDRFVQQGLTTELELLWMPGGPIAPGEAEDQHLIEACWVDDLVLLLQTQTAPTLIRKIQAAIQITQDLAVEFGLTLNYGPEKTAVLIATRGQQAQAVRKSILASNPSRPQLEFQCRSLQGMQFLDVVPNYVYLGQLQDQQGHPGCEIKRKFVTIQPTARMLRKKRFQVSQDANGDRKAAFSKNLYMELVPGKCLMSILRDHGIVRS